MRAIAVVLAGLLVAGCGTGATSPSASPAPSVAMPTPVAGGPVFGSDVNEAEAQLLAGMRTDLANRCAPATTPLPELAVAQIECTPADGAAVRSAWVTIYESQEAMLAAYTDIVTGWGLRIPQEGVGCAQMGGSEGSYWPGDGGGVLLPQRHACLVFEDGLVRTATTLPPYVLVSAEGSTDDPAGVDRWVFLGNKDQPGGPTVWSQFGPQSPEK